MRKKAIIIGGGLGGLSAAVTLQHHGYAVTVLEKNGHFGGKLMPVQLGKHYFDFGPNTITMPHVFRQVIEQTGERADDYFELIQLSTHTRNFFSDGIVFDMSSNEAQMLEQLRRLDPFGRDNYPSFLKEIARLYDLSEAHFLPRLFQSWSDYLSPSLGAAFMKVRPFQSLHHFFRQYFQNEQVLQAFDRYATYIGSSPYKTPATFAMIAHLELNEGVFYVKGGNTNIAKGFAAVAQKLGCELYANTEVTRIVTKEKRAVGVELASGDKLEADVVIMNADLLQAYPQLVDEAERPSFSNKKAASYEPSISAFVILAGLNKRHEQLLHHNVFFSDNYEQEFTDLFTNRAYTMNPTIYVCNSSYTDRAASPNGDNLFILVNAPAVQGNATREQAEAYKEHIYDILEKKGLSIRNALVEEQVISPLDIQQQFGAYRGALYGISANRKLDAFLRPFNKARDIEALYFVGGTTHPGGGSPMVTLSGMNVAKEIVARAGVSV